MNLISTALISLLIFSNALMAGILEPHVLWETNKVEVCFYSQPHHIAETQLLDEENAKKTFNFRVKSLKSKNREFIKETVLADFTENRTGISFYGFKDCEDAPAARVIIVRAKSIIPFFKSTKFDGRAEIGESGMFTIELNEDSKLLSQAKVGYFYKSGKKSFVAIKKMNKGIIVHEFGHIAGLRHEHTHQDSKNDINCKKATNLPQKRESLGDSSKIMTNYDPESIMNYCHLFKYSTKFNRMSSPLLSSHDLETLRMAYPIE